MIKNNKAKRFDCIEMKTNIQKQIYNETKNMTVKELLRYFNGNKKRALTAKAILSSVSEGAMK
jgi:hypothetical protein